MPAFLKFLVYIILPLSGIMLISTNVSSNHPSLLRTQQHVNPDSILKYGVMAIREADAKKEPELKVQAMIQLAKGYAGKADYSAAESTLNTASDIIEFLHDDSLRADHLLELGKVYQLQHNYIPALNYFNSALKISTEKKITLKLIKSHVYLAEYYRHMGKFDEANHHIHKAYTASEIQTLPKTLAIAIYNRYAAIQSETGKQDSSLYFSRLALNLAAEIGNPHLMAVSLNEIGFINENKKQFHSAITNYYRAEKIWDSLGYIRNLCNVKENIARVLKKRKDYKQSIDTYLSLTKIAEAQQWFDISERAFREISEIYISMNQPYESMQYLRLQFDAGMKHMKALNQKELEAIQNNPEIQKDPDIAPIPIKKKEDRTLKFIIVILSSVIIILLLNIYHLNRRSKEQK